jgi:hypothetical protein
MRRIWGLLKAWHAAALNDYMTAHPKHQHGTGAVTTKRPT